MTTGSYTWDNAMLEGRRRLALLERALDPSTFRRLDAIGVRPGWRCLDVGAGGGTVVEQLCRRVGAKGRVTAVDLDARFLRALELANLEISEANIVAMELPVGAFDLVHARWTLMHIVERELVLRKLVAALAPGGTLFLEEPDALPVMTIDRSGWHDLSMRVFEIIAQRGSKSDWARDLPHALAPLGLADVRAEAAFTYFPGGGELAEFWKLSWARVRDGVAAAGSDVSQWDRELAQLDDPSRLFAGPMTVSVIASKPGSAVNPRAPAPAESDS